MSPADAAENIELSQHEVGYESERQYINLGLCN